ncbi:MAG: hypothetical protein NVSMB47_06510 [Polyangiales bacterium]
METIRNVLESLDPSGSGDESARARALVARLSGARDHVALDRVSNALVHERPDLAIGLVFGGVSDDTRRILQSAHGSGLKFGPALADGIQLDVQSSEGARALLALDADVTSRIRVLRVGSLVDARSAMSLLRALPDLAPLCETLEVRARKLGAEAGHAIAGSKHLVSLLLWTFSIGAEGAKSLAAMQALRRLSLVEDLGDEGATELAPLTNLRDLELRNCRLTGRGLKAALAGTKGLTRLHVRENALGNVGVRAIVAAAAPTLVELGVEMCKLDDKLIALLGACTELRELRASNDPISATGLRALSHLALETLAIEGSDLGGAGRDVLASFPHLTTLVASNAKIDSRGAQVVASLPSLTKADLGVNPLDAAGASALASSGSLRELDLFGTGIGDDGVRALGGLHTLEHLRISEDRLSVQTLAALGRLPRVRSLDLFAARLEPEGGAELARATHLEVLKIHGAGIGDAAFRGLARLTKLRQLFAGRNDVSLAGLSEIAALQSLWQLDLQGNEIGDAGAAVLRALPNLTNLKLEHCALGDSGALALVRLPRLETLNVAFNDLHADALAAIAACSTLRSMEIGNNPISAAEKADLVARFPRVRFL